MTHRLSRSVAALVAAVALLLPPAAAAEVARGGAPSLQLIPADAAFYGAMLRNREQIEAVANSKAWARLTALPLVRMGLQQVQAQLEKPDPQLAQALEIYRRPENQQLVALLGDLFADEVFVYGGASTEGLAQVLAEMQGFRLNRAMAKLQGGGDPQKEVREQGRFVLDVLKQNLDRLKAPELVFGFRVRDAGAAEAQLKRLEALLVPLAEQAPPLKGRLRTVKVKGRRFLSLALDGKMVPWDRLPIKDLEDEDGEYDAVVKKLVGLRLSVSLGVRDNYLLLAVGDSLEALDRLGGKGPRLPDRAELKPLARFADRPLTSVGYASQSLRERVALNADDLNEMAATARQLLEAAPLEEQQRKRLAKDVEKLASEMKTRLVKPGAALSFSFLTDRGEEAYEYDWTPNAAESARPLSLLSHVGGDPIFAAVSRAPVDAAQYRNLVKWLKVIRGHAEEAALAQLDDEKKEAFQKVAKVVDPLLRRLDEITGTLLLPALADGQSAFVLDAKWKSRQWHTMMPATAGELPLPEFACVLGVSDAAKLRKAMTGYRELVNDALAAAREMAQGQIPEVKVPPPEEKKTKVGSLFFYPLPPALGLDRRVLPTAGLSERVAALALSNEHAERLLTPRPLKEPGLLADRKRALLSATYFKAPALIDLIGPWAEMGALLGLSRAAAEGDLPPFLQPKEVLPQLRTLLDVLRCYRGGTSATYIEDGATVTHSENVYRDLE